MGFDNFEEQIEGIIKKNSTMVKKLGQVNEFDIVVGSLASSSSSSLSSTSSDGGSSSSLESDSFEEVTSSPSSSSSSSCDKLAHDDDPLSDMSSLIQQLPIKRGLSRHYQGKSQSFTSLANVRSLEDLAKQENPYNKKLKFSRSFGGGLDETHHAHSVVSIRHVPTIKKGIHSRVSCSSLSARKGSANSFIPNRPPIPPHRSTSTTTIPNQPVLFA